MTYAISTLTQRPEPERFLGRFHLVKRLGAGGFAPVWLAREMLGESELRKVAIKLFSVGADQIAGNDGEIGQGRREAHARIVEEVQALCRVEHPNIVRFQGIVADDKLGIVGLVMELLTGNTLASDFGFSDPFDANQAVDLGQQLAWALTAIHRAGLVHRDIKPQNVMHDGDRYRLIDLGIASRQSDEIGSEIGSDKEPSFQIPDLPATDVGTKATAHFSYIRELTGTRNTTGLGPAATTSAIGSGTIGYMDPRSFRRPPTFRGDLYSLGATLYECLTHLVPAAAAARKRGGKDGGLRGAVLDGRERPPSVADLRPELPRALVDLIDALVHPEPSERPPSAEAVACQLERIRAEQAAVSCELPKEGPFRGLGRFESGDRTVLFGRSTELAAGLEMLRARGMLALVGPSGSGKSSLARAGIAPAVEEGRLASWPKKWKQVTIEPGSEPRKRIGAALNELVPGASSLSSDVLLTRLQRWTRQEETGVILLLDQLEELVTLDVSSDDQLWTARLLGALGNAPNAGICTIVGARRDLLDRLLSLADLAQVLPRCMLMVTPMTRQTWGEVLEQALHAYGFRLEDEALKAEILASIGDTPMPLVQFALTKLWEGRNQQARIIPRQAFESIGGIAGALNSHAEAVRNQIRQRQAHLDDVMRRVLLELTTPEGTRRSRSVGELTKSLAGIYPAEEVREIVSILADNRLLERDGDRFNFPHEALIDQWHSLRTWVAEAKADRRLMMDLERDAETWSADKDASLLWRGARLWDANSLAGSGQQSVSELGIQFLDIANSRERRTRLVRRLSITAAISAILLGSILYAVIQQRQREFADAQTKVAEKARDDAEHAQNDAETARAVAEEQRQLAKQAQAKAYEDATKYSTDLSKLEARVNSATVAELIKIRAELREKLGGGVKSVTAVNASPIDREYGAPP